jgi:hypothetical protein
LQIEKERLEVIYKKPHRNKSTLCEEFRDYSTMWNDDILQEASMTAEEKVDAWHRGTRPVNYKAAKEEKLKKYLNIAKDRGYSEIVATIERELAARGIVVEPAAKTPAPAPIEVDDDGPEVFVDGDFYRMPSAFADAAEMIDVEINMIDARDSDSYDDHYFDGEVVQWRAMWNLFEPEPVDIDKLEDQLNKIATKYSPKLGVDIDRGMLEDEGVMNICLSYNYDLHEDLSPLQEAKADTQRLIDFAGEDLANRFLNIKTKLKAPENDLYYWIKNKTVKELEQAVLTAENTKSKRQLNRDVADAGAKLVCETDHWKVYHITTFAAAQKYGRDSHWCITGLDSYGDHYWKDYTNRGVSFYFLITKYDYDPRGADSKFALAIYPNETLQVFDQQDAEVSLEEIPDIKDVHIPGIDIHNLEEYAGAFFCCMCDCELDEDDVWNDPEGDPLCYDCWHENYFSCYMCNETFDWEDAAAADEVNIDYPVCTDCAEKHNLYYTEDEAAAVADARYRYLDVPEDTGYSISVDGTDLKKENHSLHVEQALKEILDFITDVPKDSRSKIGLSWRCASEGFNPENDHFMDGYEGELVVSIYSDEEQVLGYYEDEAERIREKTIANYEEAEAKIRKALCLPAKTAESVCADCGMPLSKDDGMKDFINSSHYCEDCWYEYLDNVDHGLIQSLILMVENDELFSNINSKAMVNKYLDNWHKNAQKYIAMSDYAPTIKTAADLAEYENEFIRLAKEAGVY